MRRHVLRVLWRSAKAKTQSSCLCIGQAGAESPHHEFKHQQVPRGLEQALRIGTEGNPVLKAQSQAVIANPRSRALVPSLANPSLERTLHGRPRLAVISFSAKRSLPFRAAQLKR